MTKILRVPKEKNGWIEAPYQFGFTGPERLRAALSKRAKELNAAFSKKYPDVKMPKES